MATDPLQNLASLFIKFPGIGARQAKRFAYFLLKQDKEYVSNLVAAIADMRAKVRQCEHCFRFFAKETQTPLCSICNNSERDHTLLLLTEKDSDLDTIEKTGTYSGLYFVLGGLLPLIEETVTTELRSNELVKTVTERIEHGLKEIIIAVSANPEGDHTIRYLEHLLKPLTSSKGVIITVLGRGLSTGTELEYSDRDTVYNALKNRQQTQ